MSVVKLKE